jgi:hypothetical protein
MNVETPRCGTRRLATIAWAALLLVVMAGLIRYRHWILREVPADELYWIGSAYYFDLLTRGAIDHPDWQLLPARENPPVGKYLFGLALRANGRRIATLDVLGAWLVPFLRLGHGGRPDEQGKRLDVVRRMTPYGYDLALRRSENRLSPSDLAVLGRLAEDVQPARRMVLALGFLTALAVLALGRRAFGEWAGRLASLGFVLHPVALSSYCFIMVDIVALAFSAGAVLALIALTRGVWGRERLGAGRLAGLSALLGVALGLAVGSKLNALVVVVLAVAVWGALGVLAARGGGAPLVGPWVAMTAAFLIAAAVFLGINPTFYPDVVAGVRALFEEPSRTTEIQAALLPDHAGTLPEKVRTLARLLTGGLPGLLALVAVAAWRTAAAVRRPGPGLILVLWWWIALALVGAWIPFPWERYALPLVPPAALIAGDGVAAAARAAGHIAFGRKPLEDPAGAGTIERGEQ